MIDRVKKAYKINYKATTLIMWMPIKVVAYVVPYFSVLFFFLHSKDKNTLRRFIKYFSLACFIIVISYLLRNNFILHSGFLTLLTYSSFICLLIFPVISVSIKEVEEYIPFIGNVILIESIVGIIQIFFGMIVRQATLDSDTGDVVQGTILLNSFLLDKDEMGFGNQVFTINLLLLLLFYFPFVKNNLRRVFILLLGFSSVLLASVLHLVGCFLVSILIILLLFNRKIFNKGLLLVMVVFAAFVGITYYFQPDNFSLIEKYLNDYLQGNSPKVLASAEAIILMPNDYPNVPYIGLGPGQFSSRAGLIGTGQYFGSFNAPKPIPFMPQAISPAFEKYGYELWAYVNRTNGNETSTMSRTFYSLLSIYTEFGLLIFVVLLIILLRYILKLRKEMLALVKDNSQKRIIFVSGVFAVFLLLISFFENYLESPQAIFSSLLFTKLINSIKK